MVILDVMGRIEPICISRKLKLYIANLPNSEIDDWNSHLVDEMETALKLSAAQSEIRERRFGKSTVRDIRTITKIKFPHLTVKNMSDYECIKCIADEMICLYFDYEYDTILSFLLY